MAKAADSVLIIRVVRSGGFAGISREWRVEARSEHTEEWVPLVEACPWRQAPPPDQLSRDRFVWRIEVRGRMRRTATLPDAALDGPWRTLVVSVQEVGEVAR